jgi:hypothetical protein
MDKIQEVLRFPTVIDNNHESLYKSYHTLRYIITMVNRGDSAETINEMFEFLQKASLKEEGKNHGN